MRQNDDLSDAEIREWVSASFCWQTPGAMTALAEDMRTRGRERVMFATKLSFFRDVWLTGHVGTKLGAVAVRRLPPDTDKGLIAPDCAMDFGDSIKRYELVEAMSDEARGRRYQKWFDGKDEETVRDMPLLTAETVHERLETVMLKKSKKTYDLVDGLIVYLNLSLFGLNETVRHEIFSRAVTPVLDQFGEVWITTTRGELYLVQNEGVMRRATKQS